MEKVEWAEGREKETSIGNTVRGLGEEQVLVGKLKSSLRDLDQEQK